ncbi:CU044_5270 family protein [Nonomuraea sp. SMC257]|uniref:CU044_5270 family protein n=1 Tax=Nonomuraea montanisoli TaxID=2741721 RepID=A0A7Y6I365_9ACTN|nr:CU044_5270 family protein [Nonomuraea montanisoli]NUW30308.1 CU044_5270 family protein [Nonomuraea montanisoli]
MMDEIKQFLGTTPVITREAKDAARAQLMRAMREPLPRPARRRTFRIPRLAWRFGIATVAASALLVGYGMVRGDDRSTAYADVRELGERAAKAAERDHDEAYTRTPSPGQWLYVKESLAPLIAEPRPEVDLDKRETLELWYSLDGERLAMDDGTGKIIIEKVGTGLKGADLAQEPVTPDAVLAKVRASVAATPASPFEMGMPEQERAFQTISTLMGGQPLTPQVRAALFRALPKIDGVSVKQDAVDAAGRHGVAFAYTGVRERFEIIVGAEDYRFLGVYGENVADHPFPGEGGPAAPPEVMKLAGTVKAGAPLVWSAHLETKVVDKPGTRPQQ